MTEPEDEGASPDDDMSEPEDRGPSPDGGAKFYRGVIKRLFRGSQEGIVRSATGREIPFIFLHVTMLGPVRQFDDLNEGMAVGFDVGWTSSGLRVTVLRVER